MTDAGRAKGVEWMRLTAPKKAIYRALRNKGYSHAQVIAALAKKKPATTSDTS